MTQLYIPALGDTIKLVAPWTFVLYDESRNTTLFKLLQLTELLDKNHAARLKESNEWRAKYEEFDKTVNKEWHEWNANHGYYDHLGDRNVPKRPDYIQYHVPHPEREPLSISVTLPESTVLSICRIYIRTSAAEYDSVTFYLTKHPDYPNKKGKARFWAKLHDVNNGLTFESITQKNKKVDDHA